MNTPVRIVSAAAAVTIILGVAAAAYAIDAAIEVVRWLDGKR